MFRAGSPADLLASGTLRDAFKELRHRSILLGGLPVNIEAPFVFSASISCRAGANFVAFCLDDCGQLRVRRAIWLNFKTIRVPSCRCFQRASTHCMHHRTSMPKPSIQAPRRNSPAPKQKPIMVVNHKVAAVVTPSDHIGSVKNCAGSDETHTRENSQGEAHNVHRHEGIERAPGGTKQKISENHARGCR